jgi:hypothetical protein
MCPTCRRRMRPAGSSVEQVQQHVDTTAALVPVAPSTAFPTPTQAAPTAGGFGRALALSLAIAAAGIGGWVVLAATVQVRTALIGFAVAAGVAAVFRQFAPHDRRAPALIVILTVLSALVGLLASQYVLLAHAAHVSTMTAISKVPMSKVPELMTTGTSAITWLIIALSGFSGLRYAQHHAAASRQT